MTGVLDSQKHSYTDLAAIRERHHPMTNLGGAEICDDDYRPWPCDTAQVLAAYDAGIDQKRLAEAWANVMDGRLIGYAARKVRLSGNSTTMEDWRLIAAGYAALADTGSAGDE